MTDAQSDTPGRVSLKPRLWQTATIEEIIVQSPRVKSFIFRPTEAFDFTAGQHAEVRLTAPDGYRAQRSYSISSAPEETATFELTVERLDDGEVSPYFHEVAAVGDEVEVRGPLGGHFIWSVADDGPVLLIGGGSGACPLISMVRHRQRSGSDVPMMLLFSARMWEEVLFRDELLAMRGSPGFELVITLTREAVEQRGEFARRLDAAMLAEILPRLPALPKHVFVCGSNAFVEAGADAAIAAGAPVSSIRTERYGV
jgi:ferredoxin-NADP reductase